VPKTTLTMKTHQFATAPPTPSAAPGGIPGRKWSRNCITRINTCGLWPHSLALLAKIHVVGPNFKPRHYRIRPPLATVGRGRYDREYLGANSARKR
jgi:hypothetical protein